MQINLWLGRYRILSILDSSSSNPHVFLAENVKIHEKRIIKKLEKNDKFFMQLRNEAKFLTEYKSEFSPELYDVEEDEKSLYLIEEYLNGVSLKKRVSDSEKLSEGELILITEELLEFLTFLHTNSKPVLYIDWKPENIILTEAGVKVVDFGSAVVLNEASDITGLATDCYAAPELAAGGEIGFFTDIYGFGSVVKFLAEHTERKKICLFKRSVRERIFTLTKRCTEKEVGERCNLSLLRAGFDKIKRRMSGETGEDNGVLKAFKGGLPRIIGVCGVEKGIGVTHICMLLISRLVKEKRKSAYVEFNDSETCKGFLNSAGKRLKNVSFINDASEEDIARLPGKAFEHIIIDFGKAYEEYSYWLLRCDLKIAVIQTSPLKEEISFSFLERHSSEMNGEGWLIIDNLAESSLEKLRKKLSELGLKTDCSAQKYERIRL